MRISAILLLLTSLAFWGCGSPSSSSYSGGSSYQSNSGSQVMSESHRQATVDHMVGQGADRSEAEAFTRALNDAQREWEQNNK